MLDQSWPPFLDQLDSDPDRAFTDFFRLATAALLTAPPRPMVGLSRADREDLIQDIIYHCAKDRFRVLRRYEDKGKPFAAWFYTIAYRKCFDVYRSPHRQVAPVDSFSDEQAGRVWEETAVDGNPGPDEPVAWKEAVALTREAMGELDDRCRLLIELAADGYAPREMTVFLGPAGQDNKKISDDLRYCRRRLRNLLVERGIDLEEILGD
ncbi:MAG: hypothetical protein ABIF77_20965 [bacterium]